MPPVVHALDYLEDPAAYPSGPVCAIFGEEAFLKHEVLARLRREVLGGGDADLSFHVFEGPSATLPDVIKQLATIAMFGGGKRLVLVEQADEFVSRHRKDLEAYVARPKPTGVLVLDVKSWPSNTNLSKAVAEAGLAIRCSPPEGEQLTRWLSARAERTHGVQLPSAAADMLLEMIGPELGLLDQELAKLALTAGPQGKITHEMVRQTAGSWRAKTVWEMLDAALDGDLRKALVQLDRLLLAGEEPIAVLGQISSSLRRLAAATRLVLAGEAAGRRVNLRDALRQTGIKSDYVLGKVEPQLRRLGRHRGQRLYGWLLGADLELKGASQLAPRLILERLLIRLAAPPSAPRS